MAERTEAPTGRRLSEARDRGQVARSQELNTAAALLVGLLLLRGPGGRLLNDLAEIMKSAATAQPAGEPGGAWLRGLLVAPALRLAPDLGLILLGLLVSGVAVTVAQTGLLWANKRPKFDLSRLNPLAGLQRLFSGQGLVEFARALLKLTVVAWVAYAFLRTRAPDLLSLGQSDFLSALGRWAELASAMALRVSLVYLLLALADYAYQRWRYQRSLRMTKEEVKEELKQREGDPFLRGRIRQQQRRLARQRMMASVPEADVVITNPIHLAVAIQYDAGNMPAPRLLAKGAHLLARRIVALARENDIPVIQDPPVARALYRSVEVDQEIPPDLYIAVAEVLAYVYSRRASRLSPVAGR